MIHTCLFCLEPTDAPTDLRVSKINSTHVHIHWKPVDLNSVQGEFKEYRVRLAIFLNDMDSPENDLMLTSL